jgi:hypothetical protein
MTTTQVQGFTLANLLEIEANTKAAGRCLVLLYSERRGQRHAQSVASL